MTDLNREDRIRILRGATAPAQVVFGALAENSDDSHATPVFGEGAKDNTRGACAPLWELQSMIGSRPFHSIYAY